MFSRILVPVDGSDEALEAARLAASLATCSQAGLTLVNVFHTPSDAYGEPYFSIGLQDALERSRRILSAAREVVLEAGGPEPRIERLAGAPAETVLHLARGGAYDLIVMGTRGRGRIMSALAGSVSSAVMAHGDCPVLTVPGPAVVVGQESREVPTAAVS